MEHSSFSLPPFYIPVRPNSRTVDSLIFIFHRMMASDHRQGDRMSSIMIIKPTYPSLCSSIHDILALFYHTLHAFISSHSLQRRHTNRFDFIPIQEPWQSSKAFLDIPLFMISGILLNTLKRFSAPVKGSCNSNLSTILLLLCYRPDKRVLSPELIFKIPALSTY
jgi:hypothetical protein